MQNMNDYFFNNTDFSQMLEDLEMMRQNEHKNYVLMSVVYFILCPIAVSGLIFLLCFLIDKSLVILPILIMLSPLALILVFCLFLYYRYHRDKNFIYMTKNEKLREFLSNIGKIKWRGHDKDKTLNNSLIADNELRQSGLFLDFNTRYIDDEFNGTFKDVDFSISETKFEEIIRTRKGNYRIPVFNGVVIQFKSNKEIKNRTIISTKGNLTQKSQLWISLSVLSIPVLCLFADNVNILFKIIFVTAFAYILYLVIKNRKNNKNRLDKVTLEDTKFMKRFNVYSSDQVEARYLITPSFMQRFDNLKTVFGAKVIKCSFYNDKLMIAISNSKNLFEIGSLYKPFNNKNTFRQFYTELDSILQMVEYFKLNENIGL